MKTKPTIESCKKAMAYCYYTKAESLIRQLHSDAHARSDRVSQDILAEALNSARRRHILDVFRHLNKL